MKLKDFLKQFEGLDLELKMYKCDPHDDDNLIKMNTNHCKLSVRFIEDENSDDVDYSICESEKFKTKVLVLP